MAITRRACSNAILLFCLALAACEAKGGFDGFNAETGLADAKSAENSNQKIFNVLDYGAKADGVKDSTTEFIDAFYAACQWKGNSKLLLPKGTYSIGPVSLRGPCSNKRPLVFQVMGTIKAKTDISLYDSKDWIKLHNIDGLIVTGSGSFDGQGEEAWKDYSNEDCDQRVRLPANLMLEQVKNAIICGVSSFDSKGFHIFITNSNNIRLYNLKIVAPADSPNTDGIHISKSDLVNISKTIINTGDDCVSMVQGCTNISIKKVMCNNGHGYSIGSLGKYENEADLKGIVVKNCTLANTENGLRIKTWGGAPPSQASGIVFEDIIMENVRHPIIIDQNYGSKDDKPSGVKISDVRYVDVRGTTSTKVAVNLVCSPTAPCQNLKLSNISLKYIGGRPNRLHLSSTCINAKVKYLGTQSPPPCD